MERELERLLVGLERAEVDLARARLARGPSGSEGEREDAIVARHAFLLDPETIALVHELEARSLLDGVSASAIFGHLARLSRVAALASIRERLRTLPFRALPLEDDAVLVRAAIAELAESPLPERARALESSLVGLASRVRHPLEDALAVADERSRHFAALASRDVDRPLAKVDERARRFLDQTDELADECLDFLRGRLGREIRTPGTMLAALRAADLDDLVKPSGRARRTLELFRSASLGSFVERRASIAAPAVELSAGVSIVSPRADEARFVQGRDVAGIVAEAVFVEAVGRALPMLAAHPGTPAHRRRPRRARLGRVLGTLFVRVAFDTRTLRSIDAPEVARERGRRLAASAWLLRMRIDAARAAKLAPADALARATRLEWPAPLAELVCLGGDPETRIDGALAGLAWCAALRERYDESFVRHPATREWLGTVLSRAAVEAPEVFEDELGTRDVAAREIRSFFDGRVA